MFKIYNGRKEFFQWDLNQKLIVEDPEIDQVHFCNRTDDYAIVCEIYEQDGMRLVDIPNVLFQEDWPIRVYAYCDFTKAVAVYTVISRTRPSDYVYSTKDEVIKWQDLQADVNETITQLESTRNEITISEEGRQAAELDRDAAETIRAAAEQERQAAEVIRNQLITELQDNKVDKVEGLGLSSNDFTTEEKEKLFNIEARANYYVLPEDAVLDALYIHTDNNFTTSEKTKLAAIASIDTITLAAMLD